MCVAKGQGVSATVVANLNDPDTLLIMIHKML